MTARVLGPATVAGVDVVTPEVSGEAHVYGQATWMINRDDPLRYGFLLR